MVFGVVQNEIHARGESFASAQPELFILPVSVAPRGQAGVASLAHFQVMVVNGLIAIRDDAITHDEGSIASLCGFTLGSVTAALFLISAQDHAS